MRYPVRLRATSVLEISCTVTPMTAPPAIPLSRHLLRGRDLIDRAYAAPLDVPALARSAHVCESYFSRSFRAAYRERAGHDELAVVPGCLVRRFTRPVG